MTLKRITEKAAVDTSIRTGGMLAFYQLLEKIGHGGEAEVWSAWDTQTGRVVAIKLVRNTSSAFSYMSSMQFLREAQIIKRLRHPNIVPLYDFGEMASLRFLVTRYMVGGSLSTLLKRGAVPAADVAKLAAVLATTLDYLHTNSVVHRDLKPGNVLLDSQHLPYLTDFGLAREIPLGSTVPLHTPEGTLPYMSPEQYRGEQLTFKSDLYSLGILLFETLTGRLPLDGKVMLALHQKDGQQSIPDPRHINRELPDGLQSVLAWLTAPQPDDRPDTATDAVRQLVTLLGVTLPIELLGARPYSDTSATDFDQHAQRFDGFYMLARARQRWNPADIYPFTLTTYTYVASAAIQKPDAPLLDDVRVAQLLLCGGLRFQTIPDASLDAWWARLPDPQRAEVCWEVLRQTPENTEVAPIRAVLRYMGKLDPALKLPTDIHFRLYDLVRLKHPELSEPALQVLLRWQQSPPAPHLWGEHSALFDGLLAEAAMESTPLGQAALRAITDLRSASAIRRMIDPKDRKRTVRLLAGVWGFTHSLPPDVPLGLRLRVLAHLAVEQLSERRLGLVAAYVSITLGCASMIALIVYATFNSPDLVAAQRILNTLGNGLLFGMQVGAGGFLAWWIASRLIILRPVVRVVVATLVGGVVTALAFGNMHRLFLDLPPTSPLLLPGGVGMAAGFAISGAWRRHARHPLLLAAPITLGVFLALIGTWELTLYSYQVLDTPYDPLIYFSFSFESAAATLNDYALALAGASLTGLCSVLLEAARLRAGLKALVRRLVDPGADPATPENNPKPNFPKT